MSSNTWLLLDATLLRRTVMVIEHLASFILSSTARHTRVIDHGEMHFEQVSVSFMRC